MLKSILLASAVAISAPAFAQDMPQQQTPPPQEQPAPPETTEPVPQETPAPATQPEAEVTPEAAPTPAPTPTPTPTPTPEPQAQAQASQSAPQPATATQIAQIVDQGFPTYDKDADGSLKPEEFSAWMVALRSASEPGFTGEAAAEKQWLTNAHATADADKSGGVTVAELKTFLTPAGAS
ncbi:calcium-binding protein [Sphingomonas sp.]|uniref:calcium-binding protein n=1 Tax=Sphingomonas sp. TaxID=28214 RepID=UPI003F729BC7